MNIAIQRIKVYSKLILMVALAVVFAVIIVMNRNNTVTIWFFRQYAGINVLWLILVTALLTLIGWWVLRATINVVGDVRQLKKEEDQRNQAKQQKELAEKVSRHEETLQKRQQHTSHDDEPV